MKKITALWLTAVFVFGLLTVFGAATPVASGECGAEGDSVLWTLETDGTLTVTGSGAMRDYAWGASPWYENGAIKAVRIGRGVTSVGGYAFYGCASLKRVSLPEGLVSSASSALAKSER